MSRIFTVIAALSLLSCGGGGSSSGSSQPQPQRYYDAVFSGVTTATDIVYATAPRANGTQTLRMDIYRPQGDSATNRPAIVLAHGGGFTQGSRSDLSSIASNFARRGYVVASIDYRFFEGQYPSTIDQANIGVIEAMHDMKAAIRFLRADAQATNQYGIDSDAIFAGGVSAGAIMAAFTGTLDASDSPLSSEGSDTVDAFLNANGGIDGNIGSATSVSSDVNAIISISGGVTDFSWIDASSAPIYAAHEENDPVVPCRYGLAESGFNLAGGCDLVREARLDGVSAQLYLVTGSAGHVAFTDAQFTEILNGAARFVADQR